ncbi:RrF2 family transcriptional regulator [Thalassotalea profundi]|uniref:Transcriptional regulator n=1 Tax=Thalassotalea profundi TaxID=2036687 RepID=A0ABQ3IKE2_9GAMM|nr:Rrf2 family transcriptional regulator [Thalassotalea profundi]GHE81568.1 transcriptional regulator [Thalassotalea profundi]
MQLTRHTDYGIRILIYLALLPKEDKASIDTISALYDISRNNVNKIVHQLGKAKVIETRRGKGGGFFLDQHPENINLGDVVMLLENTLEVIDCENQKCRILPACSFKGIINEASTAFIDVLRKYTLDDLIKSSKQDFTTIFNLSF